MALKLKNVFILFVLLTCLIRNSKTEEEYGLSDVDKISEKLKDSECGAALVHLWHCVDYEIPKFVNDPTYQLGSACCNDIHIVTHRWRCTNLLCLGFTPKQAQKLNEHCYQHNECLRKQDSSLELLKKYLRSGEIPDVPTQFTEECFCPHIRTVTHVYCWPPKPKHPSTKTPYHSRQKKN